MADKEISQLPEAASLANNDLLVISQGGRAKKLQGGTFKQYAGENAEAWSQGTRGGTNVPSTDPTYHNNAKYYAEQAGSSAADAEQSAQSAESTVQNAIQNALATQTEINAIKEAF